jgi:hypothetical protein
MQHFSERAMLSMDPPALLRLPVIHRPSTWMKHRAISYSSSMIISIITSFFESISQRMMCGAGRIPSDQEQPAAISCCLQTLQTRTRPRLHTPSCTRGSWGHTIQTSSTPDPECETIRPAASNFYGFAGTKLLTRTLQGGAITHWIAFRSLLYAIMSLLVL